MCGIAGFCNWGSEWKKNIERMNECMIYRGPDASGVWSSDDQTVVLGHRRLAIVDLTETGAQPMLSDNDRYVISYNGEIYNCDLIKKKLLAEGKVVAFRGTSDTEVLLEAISAYGLESTLRQIKGMFALAVYDRQEKELCLARDRVGEKPLYYGFVRKDRFVFASDLNSITALDGFDNAVNTEVLQDYFRYGYIAAPYSIYESIWKLKPGTYLKIKSPFNKYEIQTYWSMKEAALAGQRNPFTGSYEEAVDELERLLKESIRGQMMADVPVGAFLSAGIDSSTVVSLMQSISPRKVRSFTIGMWDEAYNEAEAAREIAAHLQTDHTELYIREEDAKQVIPELCGMFGEPFADSSQIPTYLVSRMTREHVTVSLSGDGGDELFCGYNSYASVERSWNKINKIPGVIRKPAGAILGLVGGNDRNMAIRARLLGADGIENMYLRSEIGEGLPIVRWEKTTGKCPTVMETYPAGLLQEPQRNLMLMDLLMYHPDDILNKVDRTAMAVSLETRVPMLDRDVVEFAWSLPFAYCRKDGVTKRVLRDVLYRYVPRELMERPKKGFSIPLHSWLKEPALREWAQSLLSPELVKAQGILNADVVDRIWKDYAERDVWRPQIWYLLMFQQWMQERRAG